MLRRIHFEKGYDLSCDRRGTNFRWNDALGFCKYSKILMLNPLQIISEYTSNMQTLFITYKATL